VSDQKEKEVTWKRGIKMSEKKYTVVGTKKSERKEKTDCNLAIAGELVREWTADGWRVSVIENG